MSSYGWKTEQVETKMQDVIQMADEQRGLEE